MNEISIPRILWYQSEERVNLPQAELANRSESLVILGEAGMGKSHLLEQLAQNPGFAFCTARQLINRANPQTLLGNAHVLVVDALDEVSGRSDGDAVDLVMRRLGDLGYPRFIVSCRVADWRSATGLETIREQYPEAPLELHLEPFHDDDATKFLCTLLGIEQANEVVAHFNSRGLQGLLGNPQTLEMIARVANEMALPETRRDLFESAVEVLRVEHRSARVAEQPSREKALDAAGAMFAGLILSSNDVVIRGAAANSSEGEIQLSDVASLPDGQNLEKILGTRLFKSAGADRFSYWHRRIGEYLGARWLAKLAPTKRRQRRLLLLFHSHGLVPASLRGIHAWLANDPALAPDVIAADPMGVIEYADLDVLTLEHVRLLLKALEKLATENPRFLGWGPYSLRGLARPALIDEFRRCITTPEISFGLRSLLLQAIDGSVLASMLQNELRSLVLDATSSFAIRSSAGQALTGLKQDQNWPSIFTALYAYRDELSIRLAFELISKVGYQGINDDLIVNLVVTFAQSDSRTLGVLNGLERTLPESRIEGVLDRLAEVASALGTRNRRPGNAVLTDYAYRLITRRMSGEPVIPEKFWKWISPFSESYGNDRRTREQLAQLLQKNDSLRRSVQQLVILDQSSQRTVRQQSWRLVERTSGFATTDADIIFLLEKLDASDPDNERWKNLVELTFHDETNGKEVRLAAQPFAAGRSDFLLWLDNLRRPQVAEWKAKEMEHQKKYLEKRALEQAEAQQLFTPHIDELRTGEPEFLIDLARIYLDLFDVSDNNELFPHERIADWLGREISEAAFSGFEAFLWRGPLEPTADDIVASMVKGDHWYAAYVVVAALAERQRKCMGFSDLSNEIILTGLFELRRSKIDDHAGIHGLETAIALEVQSRGGWSDAMRRYHEPQLEACLVEIDGLYQLLWDDAQTALAEELASEWLIRFPAIPVAPEAALIDRLIFSELHEVLHQALPSQSTLTDSERRRNWDAVELIVNFDVAVARLEASSVDPELLLNLRDRGRGGNREHGDVAFSTIQLEWLIATFRTLCPLTRHLMNARLDNRGAVAASDYIIQLIRRIGNVNSAESTEALSRLRSASADGYSETIQVVAAEQARFRIESIYQPPSLGAIDAIARDGSPLTASDLQAVMIEELAVVQAKVKSDDVDSWRGFYDDQDVPFPEERCRDHLLGLLRQGSEGITLEPEAHVAADKEVDIACAVSVLRMPIEVKGQWHRDLWHAADTQLDSLYTRDWRAEGRGIYLVLWFGEQKNPNKRLRGEGSGTEMPSSPSQLCERLTRCNHATIDGRVRVFVLDLVRPPR